MKKYFENDDLLAIVWRWKKQLITVFIASVVLSVLFSSSLFITPKYRSIAKAYPSNLNAYSEESYSEQMLQLLESDAIRDQLVDEFNLQEHYEIDKDDPHVIDNLYKTYGENVEFSKNKFEAVEISVEDADPEMAFKMTNRLIEIYNEQVKLVQDAQLIEAVHTLEKVLQTKEAQMDTLEAKINVLRKKYRILDYKSQVKNISKQYYKLLSSPNATQARIEKVKKELDLLEAKGGEFERLNSILSGLRTEYTRVKIDYDAQYKELSRKKSYANVVVKPYKSDKKVYPVRWMIVLLSVLASMIAAFSLISFIDRINRITK